MKTKIVLLFCFVSFSLSVVSAADVAYIVAGDPEPVFLSVLDEIDLSVEIVPNEDVNNYDFSEFKLLLLNNDIFNNWYDIPVNDYPAVIVNGHNIDEWGWATHTDYNLKSTFFNISINTSHELTEGFPKQIQAYNKTQRGFYRLDKYAVYKGLEFISYMNDRAGDKDAIVALARKGTILTKSGYPDTKINADSIFFGITETRYWTDDTKQLFKNSLEWLISKTSYEIQLNEGVNLISFPIKLSSNDAGYILNNPEVTSIKEYFNDGITEASSVYNNMGYFIEASSDTDITVSGMSETAQQNVGLNQGMNLIGITSLLNIDLDSLPSEIIEVARRKEDGVYETATKYPSGWHNEFQLEPGKGYWFKLNSQTIWNYNP